MHLVEERVGIMELSEKEQKEKVVLEKKLLHYVQKAIHDFGLIKNGDRIMVCLSGGKDSYSLLMLLHKLSFQSRRKWSVFSFTLDQGQPGWQDQRMRDFLEQKGIPYAIESRDTYSIVLEKIPQGKTYCSLCSRLRRGNIYAFAKKHNFKKIALGHHRDDMIVTFLMSACYAGEIRSMPPKLLTDDRQHLVIRPLAYCQEKDLARYAQLSGFPLIPCQLCGAQEKTARKNIRNLLHQLEKENSKVPSNLLHALQKVTPSHLMDRRHFDFLDLDEELVSQSP